VLLRLAYLGVTSAFGILRLLPMSDSDKDIEILALRHQLAMLERQLGATKVRFDAKPTGVGCPQGDEQQHRCRTRSPWQTERITSSLDSNRADGPAMAGPSLDGSRCASHEVCHMTGPDACRQTDRTPRWADRRHPSTPKCFAVVELESLAEVFRAPCRVEVDHEGRRSSFRKLVVACRW
jgi:hypothetical protein